MFRKIVFTFMISLIHFFVFAQDSSIVLPLETPSKMTATIDIVYPYLWRGVRYYGNDFAIQPKLNYAITDKLSIEAWATTNMSSKVDSYFEFDLSVVYKISSIVSVSLADYYWPATKKNTDWERSSYFDYSDGSSKTVDLSLLFDFSENDVPIDFTWSTFLGGGDFKGEDYNRTRAYSSYAEIGYTHCFEKRGIEMRPFVGLAVFNEGGYYGTDANNKSNLTFTNVGINFAKEFIFLKNYSLPVFIMYSHNNYGVQKMDSNENLTKTIRNFFSCGVTFSILN